MTIYHGDRDQDAKQRAKSDADAAFDKHGAELDAVLTPAPPAARPTVDMEMAVRDAEELAVKPAPGCDRITNICRAFLALRAERDRLLDANGNAALKWADEYDKRIAAEAKVERLTEALGRYCRHDIGCIPHGENDCTCGLAKLLTPTNGTDAGKEEAQYAGIEKFVAGFHHDVPKVRK